MVNTTDEIVGDSDVQEALSIYAVDQLYANVDVQGQIQEVLPSGAEALAAPSRRQRGSWPLTWRRGRSPRHRFRSWSQTRYAVRTSSSSA